VSGPPSEAIQRGIFGQSNSLAAIIAGDDNSIATASCRRTAVHDVAQPWLVRSKPRVNPPAARRRESNSPPRRRASPRRRREVRERTSARWMKFPRGGRGARENSRDDTIGGNVRSTRAARENERRRRERMHGKINLEMFRFESQALRSRTATARVPSRFVRFGTCVVVGLREYALCV